jgi:hypothetical protein
MTETIVETTPGFVIKISTVKPKSHPPTVRCLVNLDDARAIVLSVYLCSFIFAFVVVVRIYVVDKNHFHLVIELIKSLLILF